MAIGVSEPTVETTSTSNGNSYAMGAFTPSANALLVCFVFATDTTAAGSMTGGSLTWNRETSVAHGTSTAYVFTAPTGATPASTTPTFSCTGDNATGCAMAILEFTGTSLQVLQSKTNTGTTDNPSVTFDSAVSTSNAYAVAAGWLNKGANAIAPPNGSWTEFADSTFSSPTYGMGASYRNGGETASAFSCAASVGGNAWGMIGIEIREAPAPATTRVRMGYRT